MSNNLTKNAQLPPFSNNIQLVEGGSTQGPNGINRIVSDRNTSSVDPTNANVIRRTNSASSNGGFVGTDNSGRDLAMTDAAFLKNYGLEARFEKRHQTKKFGDQAYYDQIAVIKDRSPALQYLVSQFEENGKFTKSQRRDLNRLFMLGAILPKKNLQPKTIGELEAEAKKGISQTPFRRKQAHAPQSRLVTLTDRVSRHAGQMQRTKAVPDHGELDSDLETPLNLEAYTSGPRTRLLSKPRFEIQRDGSEEPVQVRRTPRLNGNRQRALYAKLDRRGDDPISEFLETRFQDSLRKPESASVEAVQDEVVIPQEFDNRVEFPKPQLMDDSNAPKFGSPEWDELFAYNQPENL